VTAHKPPPLITIGITCFNASGTIEHALTSALTQDWPNFEVLVVDDCSGDNSPDLVKRLAVDGGPATLISHAKNLGVAAARNTVLREAKGAFVAYFDDDDVSRPDRLTAQWERITAYERAVEGALVLCYSHRDVVAADGRLKPDAVPAIGNRMPEPHGSLVADYILGLNVPSDRPWGPLGSCTLMARRSVFQAIGGFDPSFRRCAEWDLAIRAAFLGAHFISVSRPLITQHLTTSDDKSPGIALKYSLRLREKHRAYLQQRRMYRVSVLRAYAAFCHDAGFEPGHYALRALALLMQPRYLLHRLFRRKVRPG
jgi:glycosyltransferase involved in cell wall biosynthesis